MRCLLCNNYEEDHSHLFFQCDMSKQLWSMIQMKCSTQIPKLNWNSLVSWLSSSWRSKNLRTLSWKLSLASTVYHIWMERNFRFHNRSSNSVTRIWEMILEMVRMKMAALKGVRDTIENRETALMWNLPSKIFS